MGEMADFALEMLENEYVYRTSRRYVPEDDVWSEGDFIIENDLDDLDYEYYPDDDSEEDDLEDDE